MTVGKKALRRGAANHDAQTNIDVRSSIFPVHSAHPSMEVSTLTLAREANSRSPVKSQVMHTIAASVDAGIPTLGQRIHVMDQDLVLDCS